MKLFKDSNGNILATETAVVKAPSSMDDSGSSGGSSSGGSSGEIVVDFDITKTGANLGSYLIDNIDKVNAIEFVLSADIKNSGTSYSVTLTSSGTTLNTIGSSSITMAYSTERIKLIKNDYRASTGLTFTTNRFDYPLYIQATTTAFNWVRGTGIQVNSSDCIIHGQLKREISKLSTYFSSIKIYQSEA